MNNKMTRVVLYSVPFSQPVRAVMWQMLFKQLPFEMVLINPGSNGQTGSRNPAYPAKNPGGTMNFRYLPSIVMGAVREGDCRALKCPTQHVER